MVDAAQVARDAATYIREHGLAKGVLLRTEDNDEYTGRRGSACFNGALLIALGADSATSSDADLWDAVGDFGRVPDREDELRCFRRITERATHILERRGVREQHPSISESPVLWNNDPERTAEEVADLLDEVAKELDPSGS